MTMIDFYNVLASVAGQKGVDSGCVAVAPHSVVACSTVVVDC